MPNLRAFGGTTKAAVDAFERANGLTLPADYREFLTLTTAASRIPPPRVSFRGTAGASLSRRCLAWAASGTSISNGGMMSTAMTCRLAR